MGRDVYSSRERRVLRNRAGQFALTVGNATTGISLAEMSLPARGMGGDYYDFLDLVDQRIGIALADVAGKAWLRR